MIYLTISYNPNMWWDKDASLDQCESTCTLWTFTYYLLILILMFYDFYFRNCQYTYKICITSVSVNLRSYVVLHWHQINE